VDPHPTGIGGPLVTGISGPLPGAIGGPLRPEYAPVLCGSGDGGMAVAMAAENGPSLERRILSMAGRGADGWGALLYESTASATNYSKM